jgi:hypothetical protein
MVDGIGGPMELARQKQAVNRKPRGTGTKAKTVNSGKAKLNAAADKTVGIHSAKIVKTLYDSLIKKGNLTSARLLFDLADGRIDCEDAGTMKSLCSYAEKLASEPEWKGIEPQEPED